MKKSRRLFLLPLLGLAAYAGVRAFSGDSGAERDEPPATVFNRIWLEKMPDSPQDYVQGMFALDQQPYGLFQRSSAFDYHFELYEYAHDKGKFKVKFPQSEKKAEFTFTIKGCDVPPFDLCLTLSENPWGGPTKYYGFRDEEEESAKAPGARAAMRGLTLQSAKSAR